MAKLIKNGNFDFITSLQLAVLVHHCGRVTFKLAITGLSTDLMATGQH